MARPDAALRVIEQAYAFADERTWLESVLASLSELGFGRCDGYTVADGTARVMVGIPVEEQALVRELTTVPPLFRAWHVPAPAVDHPGRRAARVARAFGMTSPSEAMQGNDVSPLCAIVACGADARGVLVVVRRTRELPARSKRLLAEIAAHVAGAFRLACATSSFAPEHADAVLSPTGALLHASSAAISARRALSTATSNMDRARGKMRRLSPLEAVATWSALVDGRWSLVDHVERDGRRLVLARRNEAPSTVTQLREKEAQVASLAALGHADKLIAYELGIERTTVATHLRRAMAKLRLSRRADLVRVFGPLAPTRCGSGENVITLTMEPRPSRR